MQSKGIRGAITVDENTEQAIKASTVELLNAIIEKNHIEEDKISHVIFTMTEDLNAQFPAKFAREHFNWNDTAMMCCNELKVENSLKMCLRVLIVVNIESGTSLKHVYLKGAKKLRADFSQ